MTSMFQHTEMNLLPPVYNYHRGNLKDLWEITIFCFSLHSKLIVFVPSETKFGPFKQTSTQLPEERLIKHEEVFIWVEAHVGNSSCASPRSPVVLVDISKKLKVPPARASHSLRRILCI